MEALASSSSHFVLPRVPNMITLRAKKGNEITALDVLMTIFFSLCTIFQLYREVRIMKTLNHPNIGEFPAEKDFFCVCAPAVVDFDYLHGLCVDVPSAVCYSPLVRGD